MTFVVNVNCKFHRKYIYNFSIAKLAVSFCLFAVFGAPAVRAQRLSATFLAYIDCYKDVAIRGAQQFGVPASITLAQGLLESGAGQSNLARKANNHFGIKCHRSWKGETMTVGDSSQSVCYRSYGSSEDSFTDHARFLQGKRYASLYELAPTDYKGWAYGLQRCGYAENPEYAALLIGIIERYGLNQYDTGQPILAHRERLKADPLMEHDISSARRSGDVLPHKHYLHRKWGLHYVLAENGDTFESIASEFNLKPGQIRGYNDISDCDAVPAVGEMVWVEGKAKTAKGDVAAYTVRQGDNLWIVAQAFGVRLKSLARMNGLRPTDPVSPGQNLRLR